MQREQDQRTLDQLLVDALTQSLDVGGVDEEFGGVVREEGERFYGEKEAGLVI